ncbi:urea ABC transporter permease subunit UrtB [Neptuniibacter sp. CAU 1671]|uniref:urea ABC transporter permease subunit UrtB n=1 Tax=Neptuniibacter sp. CAU 1671 TaxID=3032593 RepID=UPI0023DB4A46|nr:urea ABC transporter permease subunit UrtB [Neptuniibacter sp. CAU 1671]MDF2181050.1 urea ABC transporter permease subunit UrtB [Neptuniibacter sp. CAU 1671]
MRTLTSLFCCLWLLTTAAVAEPLPGEIEATEITAPVEITTEVLLQQLTEAKLKDTQDILEQLEAKAGEQLLPLFRSLLNGNLYYVKESAQVVIVNDDDSLLDALTGNAMAAVPSSELKKIRVNNTLRSYLRGAIARIQLTATNPERRLQAVRSLLSELDAPTVELIANLRQQETDADVQSIMDLALALDVVRTQTDTASRLSAIQIMQDSLESEVRIVLNQAVTDSDKQVQAAAKKALAAIEQRVEMFAFIDQLFFGLSLGSVLLLAAIGLAITFGVMGVINMAHGEMIMLGAYTTYVVQLLMPELIDYSLWVAIPLAFIVSGSVGMLIQRFVIRYLHGRPLETLLATFGISLVLQQLVRTIFSPLNRQVATPEWMSGSLEINPVLSLTLNRLYILAFALLVFFALQLILKKTNLGLNVRAVSQNRDMAKAMGIRTDWVDALTFGLGSGIAGIAGVALSQLTNVGPNLGQAYIIDSFMVVVFGGVGNLLGTLVAAFSLGIANKFLEPVTGAVLASILVLVFIILFIQKRPKGLFPQKGRAAE